MTSDDEDGVAPVPHGLALAHADLHRLQAEVGAAATFGIAVTTQAVLGLSNDDDPDRWNVVFDLSGDPPWPVRFRHEVFGDVLEWAAERVDEDHVSARPPVGTVVFVAVNSASIDAVVVDHGNDYAVQREHFHRPGHIESLYRAGSVVDAWHDAIMESYR